MRRKGRYLFLEVDPGDDEDDECADFEEYLELLEARQLLDGVAKQLGILLVVSLADVHLRRVAPLRDLRVRQLDLLGVNHFLRRVLDRNLHHIVFIL